MPRRYAKLEVNYQAMRLRADTAVSLRVYLTQIARLPA